MMWWSKKNVVPSGMTPEEVELLLGPIKSDVLDLQQRFILLRNQHKTLVSTVDNFPKPNTAANPSELRLALERLETVGSLVAGIGNTVIDNKRESDEADKRLGKRVDYWVSCLKNFFDRMSAIERRLNNPKSPASATRKKVAKKKKAKVKR